MVNEQTEKFKGGKAQRVDMTFLQMSIIMSTKHPSKVKSNEVKSAIILKK